MSHSIGLVLAGGGLRGSYQVGCWKALCEMGIDRSISVISGSSIGALNALLFLSVSPEKAIDVWKDVNRSDVLTEHEHMVNFNRLLDKDNTIWNILAILGIQALNLFLFGAFNRGKQKEILHNIINWDKIQKSGKKVFMTCSRIVNPLRLEGEYIEIFPTNIRDAMKIAMASSAIPVIYPSERINKAFYYDGGLTDNIPIKPLVQKGCGKIIVIHLKKPDEGILDQYNNVYHLIPSQSLGESLAFSKEQIENNIQLGYKDMKNFLKNHKDEFLMKSLEMNN
jgi:NTE family protein